MKVEIVDWTDREENLGWEFVNSTDHINPETGAQFLSELTTMRMKNTQDVQPFRHL